MNFYHDYLGFGAIRSKCLVHIKTLDDKKLILFEDIGLGTSVTNASEQIASEIIEEMNYDHKNCRFFETYRQYNYDSFDEIEYTWTSKNNRWVASQPVWKPESDNIKILFIDEKR